jgi:hypothetical protein
MLNNVERGHHLKWSVVIWEQDVMVKITAIILFVHIEN